MFRKTHAERKAPRVKLGHLPFLMVELYKNLRQRYRSRDNVSVNVLMEMGKRRQPRSSFLSVESSEGREGMQGAGWASASRQPSQSPAHQGIRIPGLQHKRPFPPCQLSCCLDCVAQPFDQTRALCKDNCFKYQRFGVSLALGPLSVLCQKNYAFPLKIYALPVKRLGL